VFVDALQLLAHKHDFYLFEDRKFADIGRLCTEWTKGTRRQHGKAAVHVGCAQDCVVGTCGDVSHTSRTSTAHNVGIRSAGQ
jgi:hypothetical protein